MKYLPILGLIFLCGCATKVGVSHVQPAPFNLGQARTLMVVEATGRRSLREGYLAQLERKTRNGGWWRYVDMIGQGTTIDLGTEGATVAGRTLQPGEIYLRIDALGSDLDRKQVRVKEKEDGKEVERIRTRLKSTVQYRVTLVDESKGAVMANREYVGVSRSSGAYADPYKAEECAIANAVSHLLNDITPRRHTQAIAIDKSARDMRPVAELVARGAYGQAAKDLRRMQQQFPRRADVIYNLAVVTEAMGDPQSALPLYEEAMQLQYKKLYAQSRAACARRIREQEAMQ